MKSVPLTIPLSADDIGALKSGMLITLSGTIYTARDSAHKIIAGMVQNNEPLPINFNNAVIFYAGPSPAPEGLPIGAIGPTTSYRMDAYTEIMLSLGVKLFIGKGSRNNNIKKLLVQYKAIYCASFGGAAAYLNQCIISAKPVAFEWLGPEAIVELTVNNFPAVIINDIYGGDLYANVSES